MSISKNLFSKALLALIWVAAAALWLLSVLEATKATFGWFNLAWAATIIAGSTGIVVILGTILGKGGYFGKRFKIIFGAALMIVAFGCLTAAIVVPGEIIWPIIAVVITVAILLSILVVGGKKWDQGDNQNAGYKNYYQRKAEEEKKNKKED
ncbi:MAG: hypothetical protein FWE53_00055 [Firmicutes bacterium]|nr:hypothetical protein [Bacillota bacterium]